MSSKKLIQLSQERLAAKACAIYCERYKERVIPDLVLHTLNIMVAQSKLQNLEWTVGKIKEMCDRFDAAEKDPEMIAALIEKDDRVAKFKKKGSDKEEIVI